MSSYDRRSETAIQHDDPGFPTRETWEPIVESSYKPASGSLDQMPNTTAYGETETENDANASQSCENDHNRSLIRSSTSILSIRALLHVNFKLPTEIIAVILDHAQLWVCTENTKRVTAEADSQWVSHYPLMVTTPIGQIEACQSPDENWWKMTVMGGRFRCKRIIVTVRAQAVPMVIGPGDRQLKPPGRNPIVMSVQWEDLHPGTHRITHQKAREQIFSNKNPRAVLEYRGMGKAANPRRWSIPVTEEPLNPDMMEEREVVWSWTDDTAGGDVVRALGAGDRLRLAMNYRSINLGIKVSFLRVRVYSAV